jgi:hypothetical protein
MPADHIKSPADMRRELQRIAAGLYPLDDPQAHSLTASIVRACLQAGRYEGWSGEDTYTMLAWQLLQVADRYGRIVLRQEALRPPPPLIIHEPPRWREMMLRAAELMEHSGDVRMTEMGGHLRAAADDPIART